MIFFVSLEILINFYFAVFLTYFGAFFFSSQMTLPASEKPLGPEPQ